MIENVIDIEGVIGWEVTARDVKRALAEMGDVDTIQVNINSPGGYIDDGFGIYTALVNHPATIHTHVTGMAASMASVIARAGDTTTIEPTGMFMIHPPSNIVWGTAVDMRKGADVLDKYETRLVKAYNRRDLNLSGDELAEAIAEETWYTSDEAVAAGFADSTSEGGAVSTIDEGTANNALAWMKVAAFKNAPENVAESFGFYKTQNINNAATKKMVKALAQDGPAVETTKGNEMTEQVTPAADLEQARQEGIGSVVALMSHAKGGNKEAVIKIASMNLSAEQSIAMMDLVEAPEASKETVEVEAAPTGEAEETRTTLAEIKTMFEATMKGGDVNSVNTNSASEEEVQVKAENADEVFDRVMNPERGLV